MACGPAKNADAETTASALNYWFAAFGVATTCCLDNASHFKYSVTNFSMPEKLPSMMEKLATEFSALRGSVD